MNPSLHIFTVSWLLNQNIFSSRYHLLYQLSLWHRWFNSLLKVTQGTGDRELHGAPPVLGFCRKVHELGLTFVPKLSPKIFSLCKASEIHFRTHPMKLDCQNWCQGFFTFWDILFFFFLLFWEIIFHTCFPSLSPPPHIFCFRFFSVCIWKTSHLKSIFSLLLGMGGGLASLALPSAPSVKTLVLPA